MKFVFTVDMHGMDWEFDAEDEVEMEDEDDGIEWDEDGVAWWFCEEDEVYYYFDEEADDWVEYDDSEDEEEGEGDEEEKRVSNVVDENMRLKAENKEAQGIIKEMQKKIEILN
jgi:hypothetical protein